MQAQQAVLRKPISDPDWLYEIKVDGYRALAAVHGKEVRLQSKRGINCAPWYPETVTALSTLKGGPHILDGEICVLRKDGTSDFNLLQQRGMHSTHPPVTYCVFDLLMVNGEWIMDRPLTDRKERLQRLLAKHPKGILFVGDLPADATLFYSMTLPEDKGGLGLQIEGVIAKRRDSTYQPGVRSSAWRKIKRAGWQEGRRWRS